MLLFIPLVLVAPNAGLAGLDFRVEQILTIFLLFVAILARPNLLCPRELIPFLGWLACVAVGSVVTAAPGQWMGYYGMLRPVLLFWIAYNVSWKEADFWRGCTAFVLTGIPLACLSVAQVLQNSWALNLTFKAYTVANQTALDREMDALGEGYEVVRSVGVFGNVSPNGLYFSAVTVLSLYLLSMEKGRIAFLDNRWRRILWVAFLSGIMGGCATLSGTYFATTAASVLLFCFFRRRVWIAIRASLIVAVGLISLVVLIDPDVLDGFVEQTLYQWNKIALFNTAGRYSSQDGILSDLMHNIQGHLAFGFGATRQDFFIGDSLYAVLIAFGGIAGALCFVVGIVCVLARLRRTGATGSAFTLFSCVFLLGGVSCNGMLIARLGDCWWLLAAMCCRLAFARSFASTSAAEKRAGMRIDGGLPECARA